MKKRRKKRGLGEMDYQQFIAGCEDDVGNQFADCNDRRICVKGLRQLAKEPGLPKGHLRAVNRVIERTESMAFIQGCAKPGERPGTIFSGLRKKRRLRKRTT